MSRVVKRQVRTFEEWRDAARPLLAATAVPESIEWSETGSAAEEIGTELAEGSPVERPRISGAVLRLVESIASFRDPGRWELMYRLAFRSMNGAPHLLDDAADPDVRNAMRMDRAVRRDIHKMHAYVRFREVAGADAQLSYFAWFEPAHQILRRGADFFVKRFPNMRWTIATPDGAALWNLSELSFVTGPGLEGRPRNDAYEDLWRTYYRNIFNAARINPAAMQREMPQRYWKNLPEATEIGVLIRDSSEQLALRQRESEEGNSMGREIKGKPAAVVQAGESLQDCRRCELWKHATQAVAGEGPPDARVMLVGEQPGDEEDLRGHPFVGPAGRVLDQAIAAAGLERARLFVTNAVKHFKWEPRGKRRLHKKPGAGEINACHLWLEQEISTVGPSILVALGATALRALTGSTLSIEAARRQELRHPAGARILATYHPSAILRAEGDRIDDLRNALVEDLRRADELASENRRAS